MTATQAKESKIFKATPKQIEAFRLAEQNHITLYGGAIRGGKSYWGCLLIITWCFKYPNSRWLMLRETLPTLKRTLLVTFNQLLQDGFQQYVQSFDLQTHTLTWSNGSTIIFMAESFDTDKELNRFRGLEINGAFIDEINEIQEETFNKIIERSGSWFKSPGCPTKIISTCNPTNGWVKERFYNKWKDGTLPPGMVYVPAKITDNPHIPHDYLESLKMLPRYQYEVFVNGQWDIQLKTGGEFYKCFELDQHVAPVKYDPSLPLHISFDENVNPYLPLGVFQIKDKHLMMIDEIAGKNPNNTIKHVCAEFKRKYIAHTAGLFIYGDATSQKEDVKLEKGHNFFTLILGELKSYKPTLRVNKSNPSVVMRGNFINTILENNFGGITITIGENCNLTINDFIGTKEAPDGTKNKEKDTDANSKVSFQKYGHFTDLTDYVIVYAFMNEFVKYQRGGLNFSLNYGKNKSKNAY